MLVVAEVLLDLVEIQMVLVELVAVEMQEYLEIMVLQI